MWGFWVKHRTNYLSSTLAPASSSCFLSSSASALSTPSLIGVGAASTMSLASLRPRPVMLRTALIAATFFSPNDVNITSNSDCSSAAPPASAAAATGAAAAAAADTPNFYSIAETNSTTFITDMSAIAFKISWHYQMTIF